MASHELLPIILGSVGTGVILLLALPSITSLFSSRTSTGYKILPGSHDINSLYEDEDGTATPDSQAAYSSRRVKIIICVFTALGFSASLSSAVLSTFIANTRSTQLLLTQDWINFAAWVCAPRQVN